MNAPPTPNSDHSGKPKRVLVVEDNQFTATLYKKVLEREGFQVVHIADGASAFEAIQHEEFDLVLLDLMLPEMDGVEILKQTREQKVDFKTPVVVLSEINLNAVQQEVRRYGASEVFTKTGADAFKIVETIKRLTSRRWADERNGSSVPTEPGEAAHEEETAQLLKSLQMASPAPIKARKVDQVYPSHLEWGFNQVPSPEKETSSEKQEKGPRNLRHFLFLW